MIKKLLLSLTLVIFTLAAHAMQPYIGAEKVVASDLATAMAAVEKKLVSGGFAVIGKHMPKGLPAGTLIVTEPGLLDALRQLGGTGFAAAPLRVGIKADGTVSYINPEYWLRGFVRKDYSKVDAATKAASEKLKKALGDGKPFGGEVAEDKLADYRYMFGMERFDSSNEIKAYDSFDAALKAVRDNLSKGVAQTSKVYEIVIPEKKLAVIGFAQNSAEKGESWWINKIGGVDHIAAMPWEVFIVDGQIYSLQGRFRTAFAWPELSMGNFMGISMHPEYTRQMAEDIAGF